MNSSEKTSLKKLKQLQTSSKKNIVNASEKPFTSYLREYLLQLRDGLDIKNIHTMAETTTEQQVLKELDSTVKKRKEQGLVASQNMH